MAEDGIRLSGEQVQVIYRALAATERELKSMMHAEGWQRPCVIFTNLQAIRAALTSNVFRINN